MNKFKVGDRVRCIGTSSLFFYSPDNIESEKLEFGGFGWKLGKIFTIELITGTHLNGRYVCWSSTMGDRGVWNTHLELVERIKKEIKPFGIVKFCEENYV